MKPSCAQEILALPTRSMALMLVAISSSAIVAGGTGGLLVLLILIIEGHVGLDQRGIGLHGLIWNINRANLDLRCPFLRIVSPEEIVVLLVLRVGIFGGKGDPDSLIGTDQRGIRVEIHLGAAPAALRIVPDLGICLHAKPLWERAVLPLLLCQRLFLNQ